MGGKSGELARMQDVAFSPDGTLVLGVPAAPSNLWSVGVSIWRADTGAERFKLMGHMGKVRRACFSPCGRYIASAAADRTVRVWRTGGAWPCVATLSEHGEAVDHVAFSPDGRTLASGARDGSVVIRRMRDIVLKEDQEQDFEQLRSVLHGTPVVEPIIPSRPGLSADELMVQPHAGVSSGFSATEVSLHKNGKAKQKAFE